MPRTPTIRYRAPFRDGQPPPGAVLMNLSPRARRAYRVLRAVKVRSALPMLGRATWRLSVEPMSAEAGRSEIATGAPRWSLIWDRRSPQRAGVMRNAA
jgi:hypothetical protein